MIFLEVSIMCKWTRPFWGTDCRRVPNSLHLAQARGANKTNKHKQLHGIVPEMGGGSNCLCVPLFPGEKGKHINKIPRKSQEKAGTVPGQSRDNPGQSCENFVYVFPCLLVFLPALQAALLCSAGIEFARKGLQG